MIIKNHNYMTLFFALVWSSNSISLLIDDLSSSMQDKDFAQVKPAEELVENPAFSFLQ